ncbi:hypothetical protein G6F35_010019 [Rhizopus arrhizus]|nr:hypothetical protein G6F35_010019 [Rhizopus arrhizus]
MTEQGATVDVVMTEAATHFITPVTMQALSSRPVFVDAWDARVPNNMAHIDLTRGADAVLIAPASADFMAKLAHGMADDLLSTLCLARACPLLVAPAMNREMWANPATQRNVEQLRADGISVLGPSAGEQACGETGDGRMLEAHELLTDLIAFFQPKLLAGRHVLLTAGPTSEPVDPVRVLSNRSSGKTGYALARAAREAGARVTLITGATFLPVPRGVPISDATLNFDAKYTKGEPGRTSMVLWVDGVPQAAQQIADGDGTVDHNLQVEPRRRETGFLRLGVDWQSEIALRHCESNRATANALTISPQTRLSYRYDASAIGNLDDAWGTLPGKPVLMVPGTKLDQQAFDSAWRIGVAMERTGKRVSVKAFPSVGDEIDTRGLQAPAGLGQIPARSGSQRRRGDRGCGAEGAL